jgi:glucose-specific phosphotransferase system IIA component
MFSFFKKRIILLTPFDGKWMNLDDVPDEVFSKRLVGDGFAIMPESSVLLSPIKGKILQIFPTNHAVGLLTEEGIEVLIHIGIDTVELKGQGFERLAEVGQMVEIGTPLIGISRDYILQQGKSLITPIIITNGEKVSKMKLLSTRGVAGRTEAIEILLK